MLVSLRELSDWVAKQEADLLGLGPVGGDENVIRKQQVSGEREGYHNLWTTSHITSPITLSRLLSPQNLFSIMIN